MIYYIWIILHFSLRRCYTVQFSLQSLLQWRCDTSITSHLLQSAIVLLHSASRKLIAQMQQVSLAIAAMMLRRVIVHIALSMIAWVNATLLWGVIKQEL